MFKTAQDVLILGDPHLSGETLWQLEVGNRLVDWAKTYPGFGPQSEVLILGDLVDTYASSPQTTTLVTAFIAALHSRIKRLVILVGNHDIEKDERRATGQHVAYEYLQVFFPSIEIIEHPREFQLGSLSCVALPFYGAPEHSLLELQREEGKPSPLIKYGIDPAKSYDFIAAHHFLRSAAKRSRIPEELSVDVEALFDAPQGKVIAGHIHTANSSPDEYTGSLYPLKIDEKGLRYIFAFTNGEWVREPMTTICDLLSVKLGDTLPKPVKDILPVYTITHCSSVEVARSEYGSDILIRKTVSSWDNIRKGQGFSDLGSNEHGLDGLTKRSILDRFKVILLDEEQDWVKFDATRDILEEALALIESAMTYGEDPDASNDEILLQ